MPPVLITPKSEASIAEAPTRRDSHNKSSDRANGKSLVLFGGRGPLGVSDETWIFDGHTWKQATPKTSPPP
ncbi:MAG: kelch repeat-containing protein, partial [Acidimicrobiales bacterium]